MPINKDNEKLSIEFGYIHETSPNNVLTYDLRFTHGEIGEVVQILNGLYEPIELPARMFLEVAEYLVSKGVIEGIKPSTSNSSGKPLVRNLSKLNIPNINTSSNLRTNPNANVNPISSIFTDENVNSEPEVIPIDTEKETKGSGVSKEEAENFKQQRASAQSKGSSQKKVNRTT